MIASCTSGVKDISLSGYTLKFTTTNGQVFNKTLPTPKDGVSIVAVNINDDGELIVSTSDGNTLNAGKIPVSSELDVSMIQGIL